jgi:hypothetical protein
MSMVTPGLLPTNTGCRYLLLLRLISQTIAAMERLAKLVDSDLSPSLKVQRMIIFPQSHSLF